MVNTESIKTPLYEVHKKLNARIVSFYGWLLPLYYTNIIEEHNTTRTAASLFDISHLGKVELSGRGVLEYLELLFPNTINKADSSSKIVYSPLCNRNGGIMDDTFVYKLGKDRYLLIVNASTFDKDLNWINANNSHSVDIQDINELYGAIAIQGPAAADIMKGLCDIDLTTLKHREFRETKAAGWTCLLSRSGYTGEDGFEIFAPSGNTEALWMAISERGDGYGLRPAGLGARDTLRLEAACPLYGFDVTESRTPLEAGLERTIDYRKNFIGKEAILKRKAEGIKEVLVGFKMIERAIPRTGYYIEKAGKRIGAVTSGTYSPTLRENIGLGYVDVGNSGIGAEIEVVVHNEKKKAVISKLPFYRRKKF